MLIDVNCHWSQVATTLEQLLQSEAKVFDQGNTVLIGVYYYGAFHVFHYGYRG